MKQLFGLLGLGAAAVLLQGVIASVVPTRWCPDLGLLYAIALGLVGRSAAAGLVLATLLGYLTDLLSGALLGQHALLRLLACAAARLASRHLSLQGPVSLGVFAALLTAASAAACGALTAFFSAGPGFDQTIVRDLLPQVLVNGLCAGPVVRITARAADLLADAETGRRPLRLETGSWPA